MYENHQAEQHGTPVYRNPIALGGAGASRAASAATLRDVSETDQWFAAISERFDAITHVLDAHEATLALVLRTVTPPVNAIRKELPLPGVNSVLSDRLMQLAQRLDVARARIADLTDRVNL